MIAAELEAYVSSGRHQVAFTDAQIRAHQASWTPDDAGYASSARGRASELAAPVFSEVVSHAGGVFTGTSAGGSHFVGRASRIDRLRSAESGAAAGLVSVSTSVPQGTPVPVWWASNCITVDRELARVIRLRKGVGVAAKALHNAAGWKANMVMVTLTYAGDNRRWCPRHVANYVGSVRKWYTRLTGDSLRYVWVAELQERGVIHYHAVFWLRKGVTMPKADKRGWWPHGMTKTERAVKPIGYLMSYLSKIESKNIGSFPHGARIFGVGGLDQAGRDCKRWVLWPAYVQGNAAAGDKWKPRKGGGYLNHDDGRILLSEFAPTGAGYSSFIRVRTTPREIDASGPFSWAPAYATLH